MSNLSQANIANALSIIGGLIAIGLLLDTVLLSKEGREKLVGKLLATDLGTQNRLQLIPFLAECYGKIFKGFFGKRFFSFRFFSRSAFVSIAAVFIVIFYQSNADFNRIYDYFSVAPNIIIFFVFLLINIFIDWISIYQSQVLLHFASKSRNTFEAQFAIVADFLLTIKVFVLLFWIFSSFVLDIGSTLIQNQDVRWNNFPVEYNVSKKPSPRLDGYFKYKVVVTTPFSEEINNKYRKGAVTDVEFLSRKPFYNPINVNDIAEAFGDIVEVKLFLENDVEFPDRDNFISAISNNSESNYKIITFVDIYNFKPSKITTLFPRIDSIEDDFFEAFSPEFKTVSIVELMGIRDSFNPIFLGKEYCADGGWPERGRLSKELWEDCDEKIIGISGRVGSESATFFIWDTMLWSKEIPLNTFFLSSFISTAMIYYFIIAFFLYSGLGLIGGKVLHNFGPFILRSPFGVIGAVLGSVLVFVFR
jgi:hypothetical protein